MGGVTRVLITGATGFIGRAALRAAERAGFEVVAPGREEIDLGAPEATKRLHDAMTGCDAVIHLAAAMGGDAGAHERVTINGTRAVLDAMQSADVERLVLVSSMAVYRLEALERGAAVVSGTQLDTPNSARDLYAWAKRMQEELATKANPPALTVLRPGIVYDTGHLWNAHLGVGVGPALLRFGKKTTLPMCHVNTLANDIITAVESSQSDARLVVDSALPSRAQVIARLRTSGWPRIVLPFPWQLVEAAARLLKPVESKVPGLLRARVLEQRMYPMGRVATASTEAWAAHEGATT